MMCVRLHTITCDATDMKFNIKIINAFSNHQTGGNPAGVLFDADDLDNNTKQAIAAKAGFSETAFVSASTVADFKLDFFTPTRQIPHCGHATIGVFSYLRQTGKIKKDHSSKETIDGIRNIFFQDEYAFMEQGAPVFTRIEEVDEVLQSLEITSEDLRNNLSPTIVNTGNSFLIVPLKTQNVLAQLSYDRMKVFNISARYNLIGFYPYAMPDMPSDVDATTRMFGPFYGIEEESATGMAAGPLAAFLYATEKIKKTSFLIEQGNYMTKPSPSLIRVQLNLNGDSITGLYAGGNAYVAGEKLVEL
jgi:PhzF family phenazine biosynthesis protein